MEKWNIMSFEMKLDYVIDKALEALKEVVEFSGKPSKFNQEPCLDMTKDTIKFNIEKTWIAEIHKNYFLGGNNEKYSFETLDLKELMYLVDYGEDTFL